MNLARQKFVSIGKHLAAGMVVLMALGAGGCASLRTYVEPTQGDRARVRFSTDTAAVTVLRSYDDPACSTNEQEWMRLRNGVFFASNPKRLGIPLWSHHDNAAQEVYVDSARPFTWMFFGTITHGNTLHSCGVPLTYKFEKGRDYEVAFGMTLAACHATVYEVSSNAGNPVRARLKAFDNRISNETATCLDQFKKKRLY